MTVLIMEARPWWAGGGPRKAFNCPVCQIEGQGMVCRRTGCPWKTKLDKRGKVRGLLARLGLALLLAVPAAAQPWTPPPRSVVQLIDLSGRVVASSRIDLARDPWNGSRWPDCGAPEVALWNRRYAGGENRLGQGLNFRGFQNENAQIGARAISKLFAGNPDWSGASGYLPLCVEVNDWNATHARTCQAYGLSFADGCGSEGNDGEPQTELPARLVEYCLKWGWMAPGVPPLVASPGCRAYAGCDRSQCPCYEERASNVSAGGAWVYFDPLRPECRPDRSPEPEPEGPPDGWADGIDSQAEYYVAPGPWSYQVTRIETEKPAAVTVALRAWDPGIAWEDSAQIVVLRIGRGREVACEAVYRPRRTGLGPRLAVTGCGLGETVITQGETISLDAGFELPAGSWSVETGIERPIEGWPAGVGLLYGLSLEVKRPEPERSIDRCAAVLLEAAAALELAREICGDR